MSSTPTSDHNVLIAEYTLGLLNLQETSEAQALLGQDSQAAMAALNWENRFLELVDLLPPIDPGPLSLRRLQTTLGHTATTPPIKPQTPPVDIRTSSAVPAVPVRQPQATVKAEDDTLTVAAALRMREKPAEPAPAPAPVQAKAAPAPPPIPAKAPEAKSQSAKSPPAEKTAPPSPADSKINNIWVWRIASLVFALIAAVLALVPAKPVAPPVTIVQVAPTRAAIMQAPGQSSTPGWVVTIDPQGNVLMNPQVHSDIPGDASVQLWTRHKNNPQPRSLGLIDPNQPVTVPANLMGEISTDQIFEMTQEPAGGSPTASPSGPILFIGRLVTFGKPAPASPAAGPAADPAAGPAVNQAVDPAQMH